MARRGIIKTEKEDKSPSPTKTPTGRAGLPAPKRSLNGRKMTKKANASTRLMEEEEIEDGDAALKQQELNLAEQIIRESKDGSDAPETGETDKTPVPLPKRKRGRPRKEEAAKRRALEGSPPKGEVAPRRRERRAVVEKREALRKLELEQQKEQKEKEASRPRKRHVSESEDSGDDEEFIEKEPVKPKRKYVRKTVSAELGLPVKKPPIERRSKKGRPSKQENVTKQVHSIFQMDDLAFFQDSIKIPENDTPTSSPQKVTNYLNFDNTGKSTFSAIPSVSGVRERPKKKVAEEKITKFVPMPVPDVDEEGKVTDKKYMKEHFHGIDFEAQINGRLTDERAFFLEGSEGYFEQHNLRFRPSATSLTSNAPSMEYDEFIPMVKLGALIHLQERSSLNELHKTLYHQWCFELSQGFSLNMYGVGSKTTFIMDFVSEYLLDWYGEVIDDQMPVVMVANGYNPSTKLKAVIHDIIGALITPEMQKLKSLRMPKHVAEAFPYLLNYLKRVQRQHNELLKVDLVLVVHSIDGEAFRDERSQNYLSQLAALPNVWFIASSDNVNASLLWDLNRCKNFNFLWHDTTTYEPYSIEMSFKDVLSMGQSKKFLGTKGVRYVLTSLSSRAKELYQTLLQMQIQKLADSSTEAGRTGLRPNVNTAVDLRALYDKCRLILAVSNDIDFRNTLREYVEHKMCKMTRNKLGTEVVYVPFSFDEMEKLYQTEFGN